MIMRWFYVKKLHIAHMTDKFFFPVTAPPLLRPSTGAQDEGTRTAAIATTPCLDFDLWHMLVVRRRKIKMPLVNERSSFK